MSIFIDHIYKKTVDIQYLTQDQFSLELCGCKHPSYLRSMKAKRTEASISVLLNLMEALHQRADAMRQGSSHSVLLNAAQKYDALANEVGKEIAKRSLKQNKASKWVRETLVRIINTLNDEKSSKTYSTPPIIIV